MSKSEKPQKIVPLLSTLFILWLALWLLLLLLLPRDYYTTPFFLFGIAPVAGWFLIQPRRVIWFLGILFAVNIPDE